MPAPTTPAQPIVAVVAADAARLSTLSELVREAGAVPVGFTGAELPPG